MQEIPYSKTIENRIRKLMKDGVPMTTIFDSIQDLQHAPKAYGTFYKKYGKVIVEEKASFQAYLGSKARQRIEEGSDAVLLHALKAKAGWNPADKVELSETDGKPDESTTALDELIHLLGKDEEEDE